MTRTNSLKTAFMRMSLKKKICVIALAFITLSFVVILPVYAWFSGQKKAAEMYKVEYPNSLYINAAHREDQIFFELGEVNLGEYRKNAAGQWLDDNGEVVANKEDAGKITNKRYVFSVSGSNTSQYILQMAHTTNNQFTYKIYKASQKIYPEGTVLDASGTIKEKDIVPSGTSADSIITYKLNQDSHTENPLTIVGDDVIGNEPGPELYYIKGELLAGEYKNDTNSDNLGDLNTEDTKYYQKDYNRNDNVQENAVALYWQGICNPESDANKRFCDYYILEITWPYRAPTVDNKETDMVYLSVKRTG